MIKKLVTLALILTISILGQIAIAQPTSASSWNAGNIISDNVFANSDSMTVSQIQTFLNSKVPTCDTWGARVSEFGGGTRRQWAEARGHSAPFICLRDYTEGGKSSAQIIYDISKEYTINPQTLLVLIQKEQSLVTDTWPINTQYRSATGYGCPDTAPCDSQYFGLTNQLRWAAKMFRAILNASPTWYTPYVLGSNFIQYSPIASCGGSSVTIQNRATQALYNYTPYQPNQAALNAGWGEVNCGAYGNRNFFLYFTSWFGSTQDSTPLISSAVTTSTTRAGIGQPIYVSYTIKNPNNYPVVAPTVGVSNRLAGTFHDFNITSNVQFAANETKSFSGVFFPGQTGTYNMSVTYNLASNWWAGNSTNVAVERPKVELSKPLSINPELPLVGSPHTVSYTLKNTGQVEAHLTHVMASNTSNGVNFGYTSDNIVILKPGQSHTYSTSRTGSSTAQQQTWASYMLPTGEWVNLGSKLSSRSYASEAKVEVSGPLTSTPKYPLVSTDTSVKFTLKNIGDKPKVYKNIGVAVIRDSDNQRFDFPSKSVTLNGSSSYTYESSRTLPTKDSYTYIATGTVDGSEWGSHVIGEASPQSTKTTSVKTYSSPAKIEVTVPLKNMTKKQGEVTTLSYSVKNTGNQPADSVAIAYFCRFNSTQYCDIPGDTVTLSEGQSHTVTRSLSFNTPGTYTLKPLRYQNGTWTDYGSPTTLTIQAMKVNTSVLSASLSLSRSSIALGEDVSATYTIKNNTSIKLQIPRFAVAARLNGFNDFGFKDWFNISPGESITFTETFKPTARGQYTLFPVMNFNSDWIGYSESTLNVK